MWMGPTADREAARAAGLEADHGRMMVDAVEREDELGDVTDVLLVSRSDDLNTVAAAALRAEVGHGHVFRVAPDPAEQDLLAPGGRGRHPGEPRPDVRRDQPPVCGRTIRERHGGPVRSYSA